MVCFRLKRHVLNCFIFSDYDKFEKKNKNKNKNKKNDRIVNIDKEKYEINSLHVYCVMISYVRKYSLCGFRKINTNLLYTLTILIICKEKKNLI